jgi:hypothetical protein
MTTELKGPTHAVDIWAKYEKTIEHWRPVFGNTEHIRACTAIEQINRMNLCMLVPPLNMKRGETLHSA